MSSELALRVDALGKRYRLGQRPATGLLRDTIAGLWRRPFQRRQPDREFWALRDVSFDVRRGDVVGIIGRNGAGKSTLLKILSRITAPTTGSAVVYGRTGSLLEVGTGFHPDLTGRENIYLNGAILGIRKADIARRFDAIVDFAEISGFIDTPVKHYSSGMYVRLAFAVAAHMEPDILIVDEVLAVGDAAFQRKCLGKLDDVARVGRTVLFVSHNMAAVQRLASTAVLIDQGTIKASGATRAIVAQYLAGDQRSRYVAAARTGEPQFLSAELCDARDRAVGAALGSDELRFRMHYVLPQPFPGTRVGIGVLAADGVVVFTVNTQDVGVLVPSPAGEYVAEVSIPPDVLLPGDYHLAICLWNHAAILDLQEPALSFAVEAGPSVYVEEGRKGFVHVPARWTVRAADPVEARV
jgi:lipopolysaccharide transport system ATP-binding protein